MTNDLFPTKELIRQYRNTFGTNEGLEVLSHMLFELGFFDDEPNPSTELSVRKAYATRLLKIMGNGMFTTRAVKIFTKALSEQCREKENE